MNFTLRKSIVYKDIDEIPIYLKFSKNKKTQNSNLKYSNSIFLYQISNIEVKESPNWLKYRLLTQNIKPVNNIVDLSNYIMLEWGQPINIYDLTKIKNLLDKTNSKKEYIFGMRKAKMDEKFYAINNICYRLKNEDILITINNFPILIAGIISCKEFFIDYSTTNLLIECSTFSNKKINSISKNLGIRNLSSVLNSKGVSHNITNLAFQHLIKLINLNNYKASKSSLVNIIEKKKLLNDQIKITFSKIKEIIGPTKKYNELIRNNEILNCLKKLNFKLIENNTVDCIVSIPKNRLHLIKNDFDITEEISRIYGFNNLKSILPENKKLGQITNEKKLTSLAKNYLIVNGFNESIHYSFTSNHHEKNIQIFNPIGTEYSKLKTSVLNNLIEINLHNKNQQNYNKSYFEIGRIFSKKYKQEYTVLSGVFGNEEYKNDWNFKNQNLTWYEGKSIINKLINFLGYKIEWIQTINNIGNEFHPGRSAILYHNLIEIGIFTQIHPLYAKKNNLNKSLFFFELNITRISQIQENKIKKYKNFSLYPKMSKDISIEISYKLTNNNIIKKLKEIFIELNIAYLEIDIKIFDIYRDLNRTNSRHLGIKIRYQSKKRTLVNNEIEKINELIVKELKTYIALIR